MGTKIQLYNGKDPYVFISYSRKDTALCGSLAQYMTKNGIRLWYNKGIHRGAKWNNNILAERLKSCHAFVMLITDDFIQSDFCNREFTYAVSHKKTIVPILIEGTVLPAEMEFLIHTIPYVEISRNNFKHSEELGKVCEVEEVQECTTYKYDAFISYRHQDMHIARAVQRLLEGYKPPRGTVCAHTNRIQRVFRDRSELPTSGDLGAQIREALKNSAFLIVICSPALKESKWCMEEIRTFKALHGGRVNRILPLLIDGEPGDVFPEELCSETVTAPDGTPLTHGDGKPVTCEVEPLGADIRADSEAKSLYKLRTEFLRPAASILGTEYDLLYRRQLRRRRQRQFASAIGTVAILAVVTTLVVRTVYYMQETRALQADTYLLQGSQEAQGGNTQEALTYYAAALELENDTDSATGALAAAVLQQNAWPYLAGSEDGFLLNGQAITQSDDSLFSLSDSVREQSALTADGEWSLIRQTVTHRTDGTVTQLALEDDTAVYKRSTPDGSTWVLEGDEHFYFYTPSTDTMVSLDIPQDIHPDLAGQSEPLQAIYSQPDALPVCGNRIAVAKGGYLYLYRFDGDTAVLEEQLDYLDVFAPTDGYQSSAQAGRVWADEKGELLVWSNGNHVALLDLRSETTIRLTVPQWQYTLNDVVIDRSQGMVAFAYGNVQAVGTMGTGGYTAVYRLVDGVCVFQSELNASEAVQEVCFGHSSPLLLTRAQNVLRVWNLDTGEEAAAALTLEHCDSAVFRDDDAAILADVGGTIETYCFAVTNLAQSDSSDTSVYLEYKNALIDELQAKIDLLATLSESELFSTGSKPFDVLTLADSTQLVVTSDGFYQINGDGQLLSSLLLENTACADFYIVDEDVALTQSENAVYTIAQNASTNKKSVIRLTLTSGEKALGSVAVLDCAEYTPQSVYCGTDLAAVLANGNRLLLYRSGDIAPSGILTLRQNGSVSEIAINAEDSLLAVNFTISGNEGQTYQQDGYSVLELWNTKQNTALGELGDGSHTISEVRFETGKGLCYFLGTTPQQLWLPDEKLSSADCRALTALTCFAADSSQSLGSKTPTLSLENTCWEELLTAEGTLIAAEDTALEDTATDLMDARYTELYTQNGYDRLAAFEALAAEVAEGAFQSNLAADDTFYYSYLKAACELGTEQQLEAAVSAYTARLEAAIEKGEALADAYFYPDILTYTMQYTTALDDQIYNALLNYYNAYLAQEEDSGYYNLYYYNFLLHLSLIQGNLSLLQQMQEVGYLDSSEYGLPPMYTAAALLMLGDNDAAAGELYEAWQLYEDSSDSVKDYILSQILGLYYALQQRGYFELADLEQCLNLTGLVADDFAPGLTVSNVTALGQVNGFYCGDVIVTVNGNSVLSKRQLQELLAEGNVVCYIMRGGSLDVVTLSAGTETLGVELSFTHDAV